MISSFGKMLFLGLILTSMVSSRPAGAVDLINTQSLTGAIGSPWMVNGSDSIAQSFTTTATGYVVSQVDLRLFRASGDSGSYSVDIYAATGSGSALLPTGSSLFNVGSGTLSGGSNPIPVSAATDGSDVADVSFSGLNFSLSSTPTDYFIVVSYTGSYSLNWATITSASPTFNGNSTYTAYAIGGPFANNGDNDPTLLKVVAGTSVPEPSTWAMAGLAVAGLVTTARRQRNRG